MKFDDRELIISRLLFDDQMSAEDKRGYLSDEVISREVEEYQRICSSIERTLKDEIDSPVLSETQKQKLFLDRIENNNDEAFLFVRNGIKGKKNPYLFEFLFVLSALVFSVIDIDILVKNEVRGTAFICTALLFFYLFQVKKRIRKEVNMLENMGVLSKQEMGVFSPIFLFGVISFIVFLTLLLIY